MSQRPPGIDPANVPLLPPPPGETSNFVNAPSLAPLAEGVGASLIAIETLLLCLRTWSNVKKCGKLRFEDCTYYHSVFSTQSSLTCARLDNLCSGSHLWLLCPSDAPYVTGSMILLHVPKLFDSQTYCATRMGHTLDRSYRDYFQGISMGL